MTPKPRGGMHGSLEGHEECLKIVVAHQQEMMQKVLEAQITMQKIEMDNKLESERKLREECKKQTDKHLKELQQLRHKNQVKAKTIDRLRSEIDELKFSQENADLVAEELQNVTCNINTVFVGATAENSQYLHDAHCMDIEGKSSLLAEEYKAMQGRVVRAERRVRTLENTLNANDARIEEMGLTGPQLRAHYTGIIIQQADQIKSLAGAKEELMIQLAARNADSSSHESEQHEKPDACCKQEDEEEEEEEGEGEQWEESITGTDYEVKCETDASESAQEERDEAGQNTEGFASVANPNDAKMTDKTVYAW